MKEGDLRKLREENAQKIVTALCDTAATYKNLLMETYKKKNCRSLSTLGHHPHEGQTTWVQKNGALQKLPLNEASAASGRTTLALRDKVVRTCDSSAPLTTTSPTGTIITTPTGSTTGCSAS